MSYGEGGYTLADIATVTGNGRNGGDGLFGEGNGAWFIILFLIFAIFGWGGNRGFGGFGGGFGSGASDNYVLASDFSMISRQISDGFNSQERKLDSITNGLCDGFYTQAQLINGVNSNIANAQYNLANSITTNGYETRIGINGIGSQLASCCCDIREGIAGVNYNLATNTCAITNNATQNTRDIIDAVNANYRSLHDEIVANRIEDKNAQIQAQQNEISALRLAASQEKQNAYLISELGQKCPVPAYLTCNPNAPLNYSINYGNSCGCGCN